MKYTIQLLCTLATNLSLSLYSYEYRSIPRLIKAYESCKEMGKCVALPAACCCNFCCALTCTDTTCKCLACYTTLCASQACLARCISTQPRRQSDATLVSKQSLFLIKTAQKTNP